MRKKLTLFLLLIVTVGSAAFFAATLAHALGYGPADSTDETATTSTGLVPPRGVTPRSDTGSNPERLVIPALGIDAHIQQIGLTASGALATPHGFTDVGWYIYGPRPGESGSAVIAGHLDNALGLAGVFEHLGDIASGDEVDVFFADGSEQRFDVNHVERLPYTDTDTTELFRASDSGAHLNLITCGGTWIQSAHSYSQRLVVFTDILK